MIPEDLTGKQGIVLRSRYPYYVGIVVEVLGMEKDNWCRVTGPTSLEGNWVIPREFLLILKEL